MHPLITAAAPIADLSAATPLEIDYRAARLDHEFAQFTNTWRARMNSLHQHNGERAEYHGRPARKSWPKTDEETRAEVAAKLADTTTPPLPRQNIERALIAVDQAAEAIDANRLEAEQLEAEYERRPWRRYISVEAGHVHSGYWCRGGSIRPTTRRNWAPHLSGKSVAEAIADLKTTMCTHCFPDAPVAEAPKSDKCAGSLSYYRSDLAHRTGYMAGNWATCPDCHGRITVTSGGKLRSHKPAPVTV